MNDDFGNIEQLFRQKMSNHSVNTNDIEWHSIEKKLKFRNFLRFSPSTVNVYYASVLVSVLSFSGYAAVTNFKFFKKNETTKAKIQTDTLKKESPAQFMDSLNKADTIQKSKTFTFKRATSNIAQKNDSVHIKETENQSAINNDTAKKQEQNLVLPQRDTSSIEKKRQKKILRKQVFYKPPSVINHDTIIKKIKQP